MLSLRFVRVSVWVCAMCVLLESFSFTTLFLLKEIKNVSFEPLHLSFDPLQRETFERLSKEKLEKNYFLFDADLGWSISPLGKNTDLSAEANAQGVRSYKNYTEYPAERVQRIAVFGDSFTHGDFHKTEDTWVFLLEEKIPDGEVLNYGVSAYGLDQSILRWEKEGKSFHPAITILGINAKMLARSLTSFTYFMNRDRAEWRYAVTKPSFTLENAALKLRKNPLSTAAGYDTFLHDEREKILQMSDGDAFFQSRYIGTSWDIFASVRLAKILWEQMHNYETYTSFMPPFPSEELHQLSAALLDRFVGSAQVDGVQPVIVFFPLLNDFYRFRAFGTRSYDRLYETCLQKHYICIDTWNVFRDFQEVPEHLFEPDFHYTVEGHALVAGYLFQQLQDKGLLPITRTSELLERR